MDCENCMIYCTMSHMHNKQGIQMVVIKGWCTILEYYNM